MTLPPRARPTVIVECRTPRPREAGGRRPLRFLLHSDAGPPLAHLGAVEIKREPRAAIHASLARRLPMPGELAIHTAAQHHDAVHDCVTRMPGSLDLITEASLLLVEHPPSHQLRLTVPQEIHLAGLIPAPRARLELNLVDSHRWIGDLGGRRLFSLPRAHYHSSAFLATRVCAARRADRDTLATYA